MFANAQSLQDKWQALYQLSWQASPIFVSQQELSHYPKALLKDRSRYPDFNQFNWQDIASLAAIQQTCQAFEPSNSALNDAIEFELSLCQQHTLDSS
ncbi:conserved hypothetical protein [Photobacterium leiognathi lrivu.4.1]|uniref:Histidine kinase VxrA sensor domain-containing protein n=1 Tax=Photobacterium leiognathi lrivu.4.1 TaxID=1248232 RepID=V5F972_PHOLE|nr:conserved hypothetical protein [Photobacterium leiognathi lrivu.4.1]